MVTICIDLLVLLEKVLHHLICLCRWGGVAGEAAALAMANHCARALPEVNGVKPTQLFSINKRVDEENAVRLAELPGQEVRHELLSN